MSKHEFNADVNQLIELVTHSIYSNKEIFLRELISNASDALAKAKIKSLQDPKYLGDDHELKITIDVDEDKNTIQITDNGIGMNQDEVIENIGTIAKSGTKKFLESIKQKKEADNQLIGQFGIGFYSAFMVAKKIELETKTEKDQGLIWSSTGKGNYDIQKSDKKSRGTVITLYLNKESEEFSNEFRVKGLIKKHSNYVPFPIMMKENKDEEDKKKERKYEQINKAQSLRTKQKNDIKKEEYLEFYKGLSFDSQEPLDHIHLHIEGNINFKALLYIPQKTNPFTNLTPEQDYGPQIYVQNVLIMEQCKELLPQWLRFIKGVIETPDLPLNVSREILQNNVILSKIKTTLLKKILDSLKYHQKESKEKYQIFFENYGKVLKEGIHFDRSNKEKIAEICLFYSNKQQKNISLENYIKEQENTKKEIYFLTGNSIQELQHSPYLEQFANTNYDILLLHEPIDERVVQSLQEFKEHKLINAQHANIESQTDEQKEKKKKSEKIAKENKDFLAYIKSNIGSENIDKIEFSHKLSDAAAVLVDKEGQASIQMEKYMQVMGHTVPTIKRDLHINATHPLLEKMMKIYKQDSKDLKLKETTKYLYEQALLQIGAKLENPQEFIKRINKLIT